MIRKFYARSDIHSAGFSKSVAIVLSCTDSKSSSNSSVAVAAEGEEGQGGEIETGGIVLLLSFFFAVIPFLKDDDTGEVGTFFVVEVDVLVFDVGLR
mmetsp:Transcript_17440/g.26236  ORF Transcript_17440/g.26236 Transcript_17440/m.26236 type:complete len:97 (+) Transcript_17440:526-816(+)